MKVMIPGLAGLAVMVVLGGCSDPNELARASLSNEVDTLQLWSLTQGPLSQPTAYSLNARNGVRTWEVGNNFEFAFDENAAGQPVLLPLEVLGLLPTGAVRPGLKPTTLGFDQMTRAPLNDYLGSDTVVVAVGERYFIRTTVSTCSLLGVPLYGKLEILEHDAQAHTLKIRALANQNCGYRGLNLGIPKH